MRNWSRAVRSSAFVALLSIACCAATVAAATLRLGPSAQIPAAEGTVKLRQTSNGNTEIRLNVKHLAPPARIEPTSAVFVVWVRGLEPDAQPQNLGALRTNKNLSGKLKAVTALREFDLFITAEGTQTVTAPTSAELLAVHYTGKRGG